MNSRDAILQRIRGELAKSPQVDLPPVPEVWPRTDPGAEPLRTGESITVTPAKGTVPFSSDENWDSPPVVSSPVLIERFTEELKAVHGEVVRCGSMDEARRELARLVETSQWEVLGAVERPICREVTADLAAQQVAWARDGWEPRAMAELSAGLVAAERLLADTGTCAIACNTAEERLLCYLPPVCVVIGRADRLAEHMPAGWEEIARQTADPERRGELVLVTGPSRTADIEKILILGVHGPKRLVVMLVEWSAEGESVPGENHA